jgi:hypothetical protein
VFVHPTSPLCAEQISLGRPRPMLEFLFDSTRTVSDLVLTGTLTRYPNIKWVFTHGGGALPLLAERMELFRTMLFGGNYDEPSVQQQVTRLGSTWQARPSRARFPP